MAQNARIPRTITPFNLYLLLTTTYLQAGIPTNAERLGISSEEAAGWTALFTQWEPLYAKYADKKNSRTTAIKDQLLVIINECVKLDQTKHLLDRIAASANVTIADMETFNIKKGVLGKPSPTVATAPITKQVIAALIPLGGCSFTIKCRHISGQQPAIIKGANCVQYHYLVGKTAPTSTKDKMLDKDLSTKASFILKLETDSAGQYLYIYFRWYNTKHPKLAGPWNALQTNLIL